MNARLCFVIVAFSSTQGGAEMYEGIEFPAGQSSFADRVHKNVPGNPGPTNTNFTNPAKSIGVPDYSGGASGTGAYTLGHGGSIVLEFRDNRLSGDGTNQPDLYIFEVGPFTEPTDVLVSEFGKNFLSVGKVEGSTSSIDIDPFIAATPNKTFRFVKLVDDTSDSSAGTTPGADIDAVGAISTRRPTRDECMFTSQGTEAGLLVTRVLARSDPEEPPEFEFVFNGLIVEGYRYVIEFSLNLEDWIPIRESGPERFFEFPSGVFVTTIIVDGLLQQLIGDPDKLRKKGHVRLRILEENEE